MAAVFKMLNRTTTQVPITTPATFVTNGVSGKTTYITSISLCNVHTSAVTIDLYIVPNNAGAVGTAAGTNKVLDTYSLNAHETVFFNDHVIILDGTNDTLQAVASVDAKINLRAYGVVQTR